MCSDVRKEMKPWACLALLAHQHEASRAVLQGQEIRGIIDELSLGDSGEIKVVEQKSRHQPSLPGECTKATYRLQLMTYRSLPFPKPLLFLRGSLVYADPTKRKTAAEVFICLGTRWDSCKKGVSKLLYG